MGETMTPGRDDAPPVTSKRDDRVEDATRSLVEQIKKAEIGRA